MVLTVNCCEGFTIKRLFCSCASSSQKKQKSKKSDELLYMDYKQSIVVLSTPQLNIPNYIHFDQLPLTDQDEFQYDKRGIIRFTSLSGHGHYHEKLLKHADCKSTNDLCGRRIDECMPDYIYKFFQHIYPPTLKGQFLQLTINWGGILLLVRTFPIFNNRRKVVAGKAVISPPPPLLDGHFDINNFVLPKIPRRQRRDQEQQRQQNKPVQQIMTANHSGILPSDISPSETQSFQDNSGGDEIN